MKHLQRFSNKKKGCQEQMETEQYLKRTPRNKKQKREAAELRTEAMASRAQLYKVRAKKRNNKRSHMKNPSKHIAQMNMNDVKNMEVIEFNSNYGKDDSSDEYVEYSNSRNKNGGIRVYNGWELNCTIQAIMTHACKKWKCSMSEAKAKLHKSM